MGFREKELDRFDNWPGISDYLIKIDELGGAPDKPVQTITTPATLVVGDRLHESVIYNLIKFLIERREDLKAKLNQLDIREIADSGRPLHPAAVRFTEEDDPGNFSRIGEVFEFSLKGLAGLVSLLTILHQVWMSLKRRGAKEKVIKGDSNGVTPEAPPS